VDLTSGSVNEIETQYTTPHHIFNVFDGLYSIHDDNATLSQALYYSACTHCRYLNLSGCEGIDDGAIKAISKRCAGLVTLQLRDCLELTGAFLEKLARNCPQLHRLTVDGCSHITDSDVQAFLLESSRYFNR
jgi:hypothetical protein